MSSRGIGISRSVRFGRAAFALFALSQILDGAFTYSGIAMFGNGIEANPLVGWYVASFGAGPAIVVAKLFALLCGVTLHVNASHRTLAVLTVIYGTCAIWPWTMVLWP